MSEKQRIYTADKVNGHLHFEGVLYFSELVEEIQNIWKEYSLDENLLVSFLDVYAPRIQAEIKKLGEHYTPENFWLILISRWLRYVEVMIKNILEGDPPLAKTIILTLRKNCHLRILQNQFDSSGENLSALNYLFTPTNVSIEGDLSNPLENIRNYSTQYESREYQRLYLNNFQQNGQIRHFTTINDYLKLMGGVRKEILSRPGFEHKVLILTAAFRRDRDYDLLTDPEKVDQLVKTLRHAFLNGWIDIVDLCGPSHMINASTKQVVYTQKDFAYFIAQLNKNGIPFSDHLTELSYRGRKFARENIQTTLIKSAKPPLVVAHANRLFDDLKTNRIGAEAAMKSRVVHAINLTSNSPSGTNVQSVIENHPFMTKVLPNTALHDHILAVHSTDDPNVQQFQNTPKTLAEEIERSVYIVKRIAKRNPSIMSVNTYLEWLSFMATQSVEQLSSAIKHSRAVLLLNNQDHVNTQESTKIEKEKERVRV